MFVDNGTEKPQELDCVTTPLFFGGMSSALAQTSAKSKIRHTPLKSRSQTQTPNMAAASKDCHSKCVVEKSKVKPPALPCNREVISAKLHSSVVAPCNETFHRPIYPSS